jgi:tetratricopeptide (TPR) repeat protein
LLGAGSFPARCAVKVSAAIIVACAFSVGAGAQDLERKIVVGPANVDLADGAKALLAGDAREGVRLTRQGLEHASNRTERLTGLSNLCGGYVLLEQFDAALEQCDLALTEDRNYWRAYANRALIHVLTGRYDAAEADLSQAEKLAPGARTVIAVRALLRDRRNPVAPEIVIDDQRAD